MFSNSKRHLILQKYNNLWHDTLYCKDYETLEIISASRGMNKVVNNSDQSLTPTLKLKNALEVHA